MKRIFTTEYNEVGHIVTFKNLEEFDLEELRNILKALGTVIMEKHYATTNTSSVEMPHTKK